MAKSMQFHSLLALAHFRLLCGLRRPLRSECATGSRWKDKVKTLCQACCRVVTLQPRITQPIVFLKREPSNVRSISPRITRTIHEFKGTVREDLARLCHRSAVPSRAKTDMALLHNLENMLAVSRGRKRSQNSGNDTCTSDSKASCIGLK